MNTYSLDLERTSSQKIYIEDGSQTGLDITGDITIEGWIKPESIGITQVLVAKWNANVGPPQQISYLVYLDTDNKLNVMFSSDGTAVSTFITNAAFVSSAGVWTHFAVSLDVSVPSAEIYKDGESVADTATSTSSTAIYNSNATFIIGCNQDNNVAANFYDGLIDEVRVWNDIRTASEIANNRFTELVGDEGNLVGYWKLNNNYDDSTSNNNDLTTGDSPVFSTDVPAGFESPSLSPSASLSQSASLSPSSSASSSASASLSPSSSASSSPSSSSSSSPSASSSASTSASPSAGYTGYTKGDYVILPADDNDLEYSYTATEVTNVATKNDVRVEQTGTLQYMVHQFKNFVGSRTACRVACEVQSSLAPSASPVYLQIYNRNSSAWETLASDSTSGAETDFSLTAEPSDLTNYKDAGNVISCRIYQLAT